MTIEIINLPRHNYINMYIRVSSFLIDTKILVISCYFL